MHGYLRRKVTRNLGNSKGRDAPVKEDSPVRHNDKPVSILNPFTWFNEVDTIHPTRFVIADNGIEFPIDKEYKELGVSQGWLKWNSYREDEHGNFIYIYRHSRR